MSDASEGPEFSCKMKIVRFPRLKLCRLCECPVVEGCFHQSQLDKLSNWLEWKTGHRLCVSEEEERSPGQTIICQFCSWDARFEDEHAQDKAGSKLVWWPQDVDDVYEKHYKEEHTKPCYVMLTDCELKNEPQKKPEEPATSMNAVDSISHCSTWHDAKQESGTKHQENKTPVKKLCIQTCPYCKSTWTLSGSKNKMSLRNHIKKFHKKLAVRCRFYKCATFFKNEADKNEHVREKHYGGKIRENVTCVYCRGSFLGPVNLRLHVQSIHRTIAIRCKVSGCRKYFKTQLELKTHCDKSHEKADDAGLVSKCQLCNFETKVRGYLQEHIARKHGTGIHTCDICHKNYNSKNILRQHISFVHGEKKTCPHCKLEFADLKYHLQIDSCKTCRQSFSCIGLWKAHKLAKCRKS